MVLKVSPRKKELVSVSTPGGAPLMGFAEVDQEACEALHDLDEAFHFLIYLAFDQIYLHWELHPVSICGGLDQAV